MLNAKQPENIKRFIPPTLANAVRTAREIFEEEGELIPVAFLETPKGVAIMPLPMLDKDAVAAMLRSAIRAVNASAVVMVLESWTLVMPKEMPEDEAKAAMDKAVNEGIRNHPNRQECVIVTYETAAGTMLGYMPVSRDGDKPTLGEINWMDTNQAPTGRFVGLFEELEG
jgi:hypothetical protein